MRVAKLLGRCGRLAEATAIRRRSLLSEAALVIVAQGGHHASGDVIAVGPDGAVCPG